MSCPQINPSIPPAQIHPQVNPPDTYQDLPPPIQIRVLDGKLYLLQTIGSHATISTSANTPDNVVVNS